MALRPARRWLPALASLCLLGCTDAAAPHADAGAAQQPAQPPPIATAPVPPDQVCPAAKKALADSLARIDDTCAVDADCVLVSVQLEPCAIPRAFAARGAESAAAHQDLVRDTRATCGIPHPPCPAPLAHAACDAGRCVARAGMAPAIAPAWEGLLSSSDGPIANTAVKAALFSQPHCIAAPCHPHSAGELALTTDARGVVRVPLGGGGSSQQIVMSDPDYAMLTVAGFAPQRVELGPTRAPVPIRLQNQ